MKALELRKATREDFDFLFNLHKSTMREYVEKTWGWDEAWQRDYFLHHLNPDMLQIIVLNHKDVGSISVMNRDQDLFLSSIEILPEYQNKGIGTHLIKKVIADARSENKPVSLQVLKSNKRAQALYERLGLEKCGETETHYCMKYC